jgi:hypothetical protein
MIKPKRASKGVSRKPDRKAKHPSKEDRSPALEALGAKDNDRFANQWLDALKKFELACQNLFAIQGASPDDRRGPNREFWGAVALVLYCYNHPANWPTGYNDDAMSDHPRFAIPVTLAHILAEQAAYLQVGTVNDLFKDVRSEHGTSASGPLEGRDKAVAVAYVRAAQDGLIKDDDPKKSVHEAFRIGKSTLDNWISAKPRIMADMFGPPETLERLFQESAARYRDKGRSAAALTDRSSKKRRPRK